jgi:hypothetical protein
MELLRYAYHAGMLNKYHRFTGKHEAHELEALEAQKVESFWIRKIELL